MLLADRIEVLVPVGFRGAALAPSSRKVLDQLAALLRAHPEIRRLVVLVHVRRRGNPAAEERLARRRGEAILAYLEQRGIEAGRLEARAPRAGARERIELLIDGAAR
jgi:outer membrane protein OmpA-like peptidoglycan-associated protein